MDSSDYKTLASLIADKFLSGNNGNLLSNAAEVIRGSGFDLNPDQLHRLAEYVNGAVQVRLFENGHRLDGFDLLSPEGLLNALNKNDNTAADMLNIEDKIPETNISVSVTSTPYERKISEEADRIRREEAEHIRAKKDEIVQARLKAMLKEMKGDKVLLEKNIADSVANLIGNIIANESDGHTPIRLRIVRVQMRNPKLAELIESEVMNRLGKDYQDVKVASDMEVNPNSGFMKKIAELNKMLEQKEELDRLSKLYSSKLLTGAKL
ncbi:MAG: hypothetical protein J7L96_07995 [Bacteroidales bacterium]|nr:hypothetical protein [Bacteroidales bacterium]